MNVDACYAAFFVLGLIGFRFLRAPFAALLVFFGGWLLLPVGHYPPGSGDAVFPYWITGTTLPSDMLATKAWVAPTTALVGAALFDRATVARWRPTAADLPLALWCAWPLVQSLFVPATMPTGAVASLYLLGSWGSTWLLGRIWFGSAEGRVQLAQGLVGVGLASLPISVIEGVAGPILYGWVYEPHPFRFADVERYAGYRPIGFLENGNHFGLWICLCALAATWFAASATSHRHRRVAGAAAAVLLVMAFAAQSAGALVLLACGAGFLGACRWLRPRTMAIAFVAALAGGGGVYLSGKVPVDKLRQMPLVENVVDGLRRVGRGSFGWRIAQDQRLISEATQHPLVGSGRWDWWRARQTRPWGLPVLLLGQYGLIGLWLAFGALLWAAVREAWRAPRASGWHAESLPLMLATLITLAAMDALLNSFIFFPAIALAGSLAGVNTAATYRRGDIVRLSSQAAR